MAFIKFAMFFLASGLLLVGCNPNRNQPGRFDRNQPALASPNPAASVAAPNTGPEH